MSHMSVTVVTSQMDRKGRQHWVLKVGYRGREYGLRKRFSDMAKLSNHLNSSVLRGLVLPCAFPEKNYPWSSSKRDEDVLRKRQMGIQAWFDQLISMGVCNSILNEFLLVDDWKLLSLRQEAELNGLVVMNKQQLALDSCKQNMLPLARQVGVLSSSPRELGRPPLAPRSASSSSSSRHISIGSGTTPPASLSSSPASSSFASTLGFFGRRGAGDRSRGGSVVDDSGAAGIAAISSSQPRQSSTLSLALAASLPSSGATSIPQSAPPRSQSGSGVNVSNGSTSATSYRAQALSSGSYTQSSSLSSLSHALAAAAGSSRGPSPAATSSAGSSYSRSIGGSFSGSRSFSGIGGAFLDIHMMGAADLQSTMLSDSFGQHVTRLWKQHGEDTMDLLERICCSTLPVAAAEVDEVVVSARTRGGERAALDDFSSGVLEDDILGLESVFDAGPGNSEGAGVVGVLDAPLVFLSSDFAEGLIASLKLALPAGGEETSLVTPVSTPPRLPAAPLPPFPPHILRPPLDIKIGSIPQIPRRKREVFFFPR